MLFNHKQIIFGAVFNVVLYIGGVSFKVDLPTPLKIPSCSFKQVFKFMIINSVDTHHFNLVLKLIVSET